MDITAVANGIAIFNSQMHDISTDPKNRKKLLATMRDARDCTQFVIMRMRMRCI